MATVYDNNDLVWTSRGDYVISHNGDIMDSNNDPLRSIFQEIRTRIKSDLGDWKLNEDIGGSLSDFVGQPNNKLTAETIKTRIKACLVRHGLVNSRDLTIKYIPIDADKLMFRLSLSVAQTAKNRSSQTLGINVLYHYAENNVYVTFRS